MEEVSKDIVIISVFLWKLVEGIDLEEGLVGIVLKDFIVVEDLW